jgi:hypothetical protein
MSTTTVGYFLAAEELGLASNRVYGSYLNQSTNRSAAVSNFIDAVALSGHSAVEISDLTASTLSSLDVLWYERPLYHQSSSLSHEYKDSLDNNTIGNFLDDGGTLIYNDWTLNYLWSNDSLPSASLSDNLPSYTGPELVGSSYLRDYSRNVDIANLAIANSDHPTLSIDDSDLDGGWYTNFGSVYLSELDADTFDVLLTDSSFHGRDGLPLANEVYPADLVSSFAYEAGQGDVILTTIPVAGYLDLNTHESDWGFTSDESLRPSGSNTYEEIQDSVKSYVANLVDDTRAGSSTKDLIFSHKLYHEGGAVADSLVASPYGNVNEQSKKYILEISAQNKAGESLNLNCIDLTFDFENSYFHDISKDDISIDSEFSLFGATSIDNASGSIRIAAASGEHLDGGAGIADGSTGAVFRVSLDLDDEAFKQINDLPEIDFNITANVEDTLFLGTAYSDSSDYVIQSLRDIGGTSVVGLQGDDYDMEWQNSTGTTSVDISRTSSSEVYFGSQRFIGSSDITNLVRSGDTLDSIGHLSFENIGSSSATVARIKAVNGSDAPAYIDFSLQHTNLQNDSVVDYGYSTEVDSLTINAGSESNGQQNTDDRDQLDLNYRLYVIGKAGDVVDTSQLGVEFSAAGGYRSTQYLGDTKNLITYQADVDYDGRVSMSDLAHINAGAHYLESDQNASISDVDVNYDGDISISDLTAMDKDWGKSLHDAQYSDSFTGVPPISLAELTSQTTGRGDVTWTDNSFATQNQLEDFNFVGSLVSQGSSNYHIGLSDINKDDLMADTYIDFQANNS